jgi:tetratricopeptide (TPR) repeat protein
VHTVGLGTARGAKIALPVEGGETYLKDRAGRDVVSALDTAGLKRIASIAGGTSTTVAGGEPGSLAGLYEREILPLARTALSTGERRREDRYQWPLLVAFLLWLVELGMTDRARVRAPKPAFAAATLLLLAPFLVGGCDATTEGRQAWEAGDEEAALARFDAAVAETGEGASAALLYDQAVAALAVGEYEKAEAAAREAILRDEDAYAGLDAFVRGSAAFARSQVAFVQASATPDDPRAMMPALRFAEDALAGWQWAAASRPDWPEARRNAERGLLWLQDLRELRAGDGQRKPPPPDETDPEEEKPPEPLPPLETEDLPSGRVLGLLELLQAKEQKKILERRARRHVRGGSVEKDW